MWKHLLLAVCASCCTRCTHTPLHTLLPQASHNPEIPHWVFTQQPPNNQWCGWGVAGPAFSTDSPYPKQLSKERALRNLAGTFGTSVQEAMIDQESLHQPHNLETVRITHVDPAFVAQLEPSAEITYWTDTQGVGPFQQKLFTYAQACIQRPARAPAAVQTQHAQHVLEIPTWLKDKQAMQDGRMCAVGYAEPVFFAEDAFETIVEDIRGQLLDVVTTFVSHYYEELAQNNTMAIENMTLSSTQAVSRGVVVTHYWYDSKGLGPQKKPRSTYGYGCMYPMDAIESVLQNVQYSNPPQNPLVLDAVKERARTLFETLEAEEDKTP
jgi:hypothetical protein